MKIRLRDLCAFARGSESEARLHAAAPARAARRMPSFIGTGGVLDEIRVRRGQSSGRAKSAPPEALELDGLVLQLRDAGLSYRKIALEARVGRRFTRQAVHQRVQRLLFAADGEPAPRRIRKAGASLRGVAPIISGT